MNWRGSKTLSSRRDAILRLLALTFAVVAMSTTAMARPYVVRAGDTLFGIATRELGEPSRWMEIARANNITPPYPLRLGQTIDLPDTGSVIRNDSAVREDSSPGVSPDSPELINTDIPDTGILFHPLSDTAPVEAVAVWSDEFRPASAPGPAMPLTLQQAIDLGLVRAPEIAAASADLERVREQIGVVRSSALPQVSARGDARRFETFKSNSALGLDEATYGGSININQAIFSFGRLSHALKAVKAEEAAALAALAQARADVRFRVESSFLAFLLARERLAVALEALSVSEALLHAARVKEQVGTGTSFDVSRARTDRSNSIAIVVTAQSAVDAARDAFATATGLPPSSPLIPQGSLRDDRRPVPPTDGESLVLSERPDIAVLRHRVDAANARVGFERAQGRPSIDAIASGTYTRHEYITSSPFFKGQDASSGFVGVGVTVPIFDGFRVKHAVKAQEAAAASTEAVLERAELEAVREVRAIYHDLGAAREILAARLEGVQSATESVRQAQVAFEAGRASSLDVIQASLALADARRAEAEASHAYRLGLARLIRATGTELAVKGGDSL